GVQTCALPILPGALDGREEPAVGHSVEQRLVEERAPLQILRAPGSLLLPRAGRDDPQARVVVLAVVGGEAEPDRVRLVEPGEQVDGLRPGARPVVLPRVERIAVRPRQAEALPLAHALQLLDRLPRRPAAREPMRLEQAHPAASVDRLGGLPQGPPPGLRLLTPSSST